MHDKGGKALELFLKRIYIMLTNTDHTITRISIIEAKLFFSREILLYSLLYKELM